MNRRITTLWIAGICAALALVGVVVATLLIARTPEKVAVQAQTAPQSGTSGVNVQGSGAAIVKPDVVKFSAGVEVRAQTVGDAQKQAATKLDAIKSAVTGLGVKPEDIVTNSYDISPNYVYVNQQPPRLDGYIVRSQLGLTIRDVSKAGPIIDAVGAVGANLIGGISFTLDNNADAIKQARSAAMEDAKAKADQLAKLGNFTLGSVISVSELGNTAPRTVQPVSGAGVAASAPAPQADTVIEGGQFKVIVNVQVVYAIK